MIWVINHLDVLMNHVMADLMLQVCMEIHTPSLYLEWALGDLLQESPVSSGPGWGSNDFLNHLCVLFVHCSKAWGSPSLHEGVHTKFTLSLSPRLACGLCQMNYGGLWTMEESWRRPAGGTFSLGHY